MGSHKFGFSLLLAAIFLAAVICLLFLRDSVRDDSIGEETQVGAPALGGHDVARSRELPGTDDRDAVPPRPDVRGRFAPTSNADDDPPVSLQGRVMNPDGDGVPGARVAAADARAWDEALDLGDDLLRNPVETLDAYRREYAELARKAPATQASPDGVYVFRALKDGEYRIVVSHPDYLPERNIRVSIAEGQTSARDIQLVPGRLIAGRVVDEEGLPLKDVAVSCRPADESRVKGIGRVLQFLTDLAGGGALLGVGEARSGDDGSFRLGSLEPVLYDLRARKDGYAPSEARKVPAGTGEMILVLGRGAAIAGRVVDPRRRPLEGVEVLVRQPPVDRSRMANSVLMAQADIDVLGEKTRRGSSGEAGYFRLDGIEEGLYELRIVAESFPEHCERVSVSEGLANLGEIVLDRPMAIAGMVQGPSGSPISGARVWATATGKDGRSRWAARPSEAVVEAQSDGGGLFRLDPLKPGAYVLRAVAEERGEAFLDGVEAGRSDVVITLGEGLTVAGTVLDAENRSPVSGASVGLVGGAPRTVVTGEDGRFELRGIAQNSARPFGGGVNLRVRHPDYRRTIARAGADGEAVEILLPAVRVLRGVVVDGRGNPVAGARVSADIPGMPPALMAVAPGGRSSGYSSEDGGFALRPPAMAGAGAPVEVAASHPLHGRGRAGPLRAERQGEAWPELRLVLGRGSAIEGRVVDPRGAPIRGARVRGRRQVELSRQARMFAQLLPMSAAATAYTARDGTFALRELEPGTYRVDVAASGYAPSAREEVEVGETPAQLEIELEPGASISGRVVDSSRLPVAGAEIVAFLRVERSGGGDDAYMADLARKLGRAGGAGVASTRSDEGGRFELTHLPEGEFLIVARASGFEPAEAEGVGGGEEIPDLVLTAYARLAGRVTDQRTGLPVSRFEVGLRAREGRRGLSRTRLPARSFEDPDGRFRYGEVPAGSFEVRVRSEDHAPAFRAVELEPGREREVAVELEPGARVEGEVRAATSEPLPGVRVHLVRIRVAEGNGASETVRHESRDGYTREDGTFAFGGVTPGDYRLSLLHPDYCWEGDPGGLEFTVVDGEPAHLVLSMSRAGRLKGRVRNLFTPYGEAIYRVFLTPVEASGEGAAASRAVRLSARVNANGEYRADSLRPGTYRLELERAPDGEQSAASGDEAGARQLLGEVEIRAGETETIDTEAR